MNTGGLHAALLAAMDAGDRTEENRLRWALVLSAGDYLTERVHARAAAYSCSKAEALAEVQLYVAENIHRWQPERGPLRTWLRYYVQLGLNRRVAPVAHALLATEGARHARSIYRQARSAGYSRQEAANVAGGSRNGKWWVYERPQARLDSMDAPLSEDGDLNLHRVLGEGGEDDMHQALDVGRLASALQQLSADEQDMLSRRHGLGVYGPHTIQQLATRAGISREGMRNRLLKAEQKLTDILTPAPPPPEIEMPCEIHPHKTIRDHGGCDTCLTNVRGAARRYDKTGKLPKPDSVVMQILTFLDVSKIRTKQETVQRLVDALQEPEAPEVVQIGCIVAHNSLAEQLADAEARVADLRRRVTAEQLAEQLAEMAKGLDAELSEPLTVARQALQAIAEGELLRMVAK